MWSSYDSEPISSEGAQKNPQISFKWLLLA